MTQPASSDVQELISEVSYLAKSVKDGGAEVSRLRVAYEQMAHALRRQKVALIISIIGLCLDLALSGLFLYQHERQSCTNRRSDAFFKAEFNKVQGQVDGLKELMGANGNQAKAREGLDQFITASQTYLDKIHGFQTQC
jgi:hypothetical protein